MFLPFLVVQSWRPYILAIYLGVSKLFFCLIYCSVYLSKKKKKTKSLYDNYKLGDKLAINEDFWIIGLEFKFHLMHFGHDLKSQDTRMEW